MLDRGHAWLHRHPGAADALLAAAVLALALTSLTGEAYEGTAAEAVATVLLVAPLALRRRTPVGSFAAVMVACGVQLLLVDVFLPANGAALVALYTLVAYAPRPVAAAGFAVALAGTVPFALHFDDIGEEGRVLGAFVLAVHLTLAAMLGDRRREALRERAVVEERAALLAAELEHEAALATAAERERIARELHDVVGHALAVVVSQADGGRYGARSDPAAATAALDTIGATARDALDEMRRAVGALHDGGEPLRPRDGTDDLTALVDRARAAGVDVELDEEGTPLPLTAGASLTIYRVVQEALTNVLKHAGRRARATVALRWRADAVTVVVRDHGGGAPTPPSGASGRGLAGMRARVEARGGTVAAGPHPQRGFEVRATIPVGGAE